MRPKTSGAPKKEKINEPRDINEYFKCMYKKFIDKVFKITQSQFFYSHTKNNNCDFIKKNVEAFNSSNEKKQVHVPDGPSDNTRQNLLKEDGNGLLSNLKMIENRIEALFLIFSLEFISYSRYKEYSAEQKSLYSKEGKTNLPKNERGCYSTILSIILNNISKIRSSDLIYQNRNTVETVYSRGLKHFYHACDKVKLNNEFCNAMKNYSEVLELLYSESEKHLGLDEPCYGENLTTKEISVIKNDRFESALKNIEQRSKEKKMPLADLLNPAKIQRLLDRETTCRNSLLLIIEKYSDELNNKYLGMCTQELLNFAFDL